MAEIENLQIVGGAIYTVGNQDIIADDWGAGKAYIKDRSYAIKDHKLYQCAVSHTSVEPFDPTKWTEKTVAEALGTAGSANMIECTLAEYTAWKAGGQLINETVYVITDAPNLNATAEDISYDGSAVTVKDKVDSLENSTLKVATFTASVTTSGTSPIFIGEVDISTMTGYDATKWANKKAVSIRGNAGGDARYGVVGTIRTAGSTDLLDIISFSQQSYSVTMYVFYSDT